MGIRLGLSLLLLLLAHASGACTKAARDGPTSIPPRSHQQHQHHVHHRPHRQVPRQARALSEFLVPPPAPANFRGPRGPHPPYIQQHPKNSNHNQPPPPPLPPPPLSPSPPPQVKNTRNGRYVNQQGGPGSNSNNGPGYFSKIMSWLNPFNDGNSKNGDVVTKDSHSQGASNFPLHQQYAPQQPYGYVNAQYEPPPHPANVQGGGHSNLRAWMNGKPCNPCNQIPWIPVLHDSVHSSLGQYAPNAGSDGYLAPPPPQEIKTPDFSHTAVPGPNPGNQQNFPIPNPHLYPGAIPPLFKAKPFNDGPSGYSPPNVNQPPPPNFDHQPSAGFNHQPTLNLDPQPPPQFDHQPPPDSDHQPPPNFDQSLSSYDHPPGPSNFDHPSTSNFDHPPPSNFNNGPPQNFHHPPSPDFNYQSPQNLDHPSSNFDQQPSQSYEDHLPPEFQHQQSSNFDYQSPNFNNGPPSNYDDQHPSSNIEQHHQPSQIVGIVTDPPSDLDHSDVNHNQEPDHAESRPVFVNSATSSSIERETLANDTDRYLNPQKSEIPSQNSNGNTVVHFQRSPIIDLSVAGESSTTSTTTTVPSGGNRFQEKQSTDPPALKGKPERHHRESSTPVASVIDYIVSSPDEVSFDSSEEEKETRPTALPPRRQHQSALPSVTTTTTTVTPKDQRQQESALETLVQSYEFYKKKNDTGTREEKQGGRMYNDTDDYSASKEIVGSNKAENGKKIIIPYTSQYTPSPFHSTQSINGHARHEDNTSSVSSHQPKITYAKDNNNSDEDNVVSQESRRVSVVQNAPEKLRNKTDLVMAGRMGNAIDVHRLQKNIDNWTIQEYSKATTSVSNNPNSTYPRWLSSKQIPDEYLLSAKEFEESSEYYDFSNGRELHRGRNKSEATTTETVTKVKIINATYPKKAKKPELPPKSSNRSNTNSTTSERVYVVTPVPNPNSLENFSSEKSEFTKTRTRKPKQDTVSVERAYQVLPQAVNNLAVLSSAPESAAPALWGIMEHEEFAAGADQPRWRSESDALPEPASTPILYTGHSKVSRAR